jgi:hypothetical protein
MKLSIKFVVPLVSVVALSMMWVIPNISKTKRILVEQSIIQKPILLDTIRLRAFDSEEMASELDTFEFEPIGGIAAAPPPASVTADPPHPFIIYITPPPAKSASFLDFIKEIITLLIVIGNIIIVWIQYKKKAHG